MRKRSVLFMVFGFISIMILFVFSLSECEAVEARDVTYEKEMEENLKQNFLCLYLTQLSRQRPLKI